MRLLRGRRASLSPFRSKRSTLRLSNGTAMIFVGDTDNLLTGLSHRMAAKGERMFLRSHTLAVRSSEPEMTLSSRVKVAQVTVLQWKMEMQRMQCNAMQWKMDLLRMPLKYRHRVNGIAKIPQAESCVFGRGYHQSLHWMGWCVG